MNNELYTIKISTNGYELCSDSWPGLDRAQFVASYRMTNLLGKPVSPDDIRQHAVFGDYVVTVEPVVQN